MTIRIQDIALSKLVPSKANVRRTGKTERIEELAASIAAHGLLQNLTVKPVENERFEVIAGGRRLAALKLLAKRKQWAKDAPIPCQIAEGENVTEISLAENALQCPMHPADQFEAFAELHRQEMSVEDIAARFGVTANIVMQRLKLGAVSPKLMKLYRAGEMNLEQLSAFAITDDHSLQERVWKELGYNKSRRAILEALHESAVPGDDRRALYVGEEAYIAAGGHITRDLFDEEGSGYFDDGALLDRLANEKLALEAEALSAEGWKWVAVELSFDHGFISGLRRIHPMQREQTEEEEMKIAELSARYDELRGEADGEESEELEAALAEIEHEVKVLLDRRVYDPAEMATAGALVSLGRDGTPLIGRGFVHREDDPKRDGEGKARDGDAKKAKDELPARLVAELTAHRTAALANELAQKPALALIAVTHALASRLFYLPSLDASCLRIEPRETRYSGYAKEMKESPALKLIEQRHAEWQQRMPEDASELWAFIVALSEAERLGLLAHCASLTLDAVIIPKMAGAPATRHAADQIASALGLDMAARWQPNAAYFGRIAKTRILQAVREGASPEAAQAIEALKKPVMAERAAKLLAGKGWLPEPLRMAAA